MIVGLRLDAKHSSSCFSKQHLTSWQHMFKRIPIYKREVFQVSSMASHEKSVKHLLAKIEEECRRIFSTHSIQIPSSYRNLLQWIEKENKSTSLLAIPGTSDDQESTDENHQQYFVSVDDLHSKYTSSLVSSAIGSLSVDVTRRMLRYLHAIGYVVIVDANTVCTDTTIIPKIVANFVSPDEVRIKLFRERNIEILDLDNIRCLLNIEDASEK